MDALKLCSKQASEIPRLVLLKKINSTTPHNLEIIYSRKKYRIFFLIKQSTKTLQKKKETSTDLSAVFGWWL